MKKNYLKLTQLFGFVFTLFMLTCFYSCDKHEQLDGTIWKSDYFEIEYKDPTLPSYLYLNEGQILRGILIFDFKQGFVLAKTSNIELYDKKNDIIRKPYTSCCPHEYGFYTYDKKKLTLTFDNAVGFFSDQIWRGKVKTHTINLKVPSNETITFKKQ